MSLLTISVVVCAFNEEEILSDCLVGLAAQVYAPDSFEVIIVDDESNDRTTEIATDFVRGLGTEGPRGRLIRIEHGGLSIARNVGIKHSTGDVVAFIDGDAVPHESWLSSMAEVFADGAEFVGGRIDLLNTESAVARFLQRTRNHQYFGPKVFNDQFIGCNMAFRRQVFESAGGFNENFIARGDDSSLRARVERDFKYVAAPKSIVYHKRPESVRTVFRTEWKSATLTPLIEKAADEKFSVKKGISLGERLLVALVPLLVLLFLLFGGVVLPVLAISILASARRLFVRPLSRARLSVLLSNYGIAKGFIGHVVYEYSQSFIGSIGYLWGLVVNKGIAVISPMASNTRILKTVDSKPDA